MGTARRRLIVPEVVQTSAMDCGPAALKSLLAGFGRLVSYGRLREACQTDVDGTSIDTLEDIAVQLGLDAEQVVVPVDHLLIDETDVLPGIIVVRLPIGFTHFVVLWRSHGAFVQLMDPATGRRFATRREFLRNVYVHSIAIPAAAFREYAGSEEFLAPLRIRMKRSGMGRDTRRLVDAALADAGWRSLACLDAAVRFVETMVRAKGVRRGREATRLVGDLFEQLRQSVDDEEVVPPTHWFARPTEEGPDGEEQVVIQGAVVVRVRSRGDEARDETASEGEEKPLSPELLAALHEPPSRPLLELVRMVGADGLLTPAACVLAMLLAAAGTAIEAILLRALFDVGRYLGVTDKRVWAVGSLLLFLAALLLVELPLASTLMRMGRKLDARFRLAFLQKIPRLGDRYFQSRPISDMAERSHGVFALRALPTIGAHLLRTAFSLVFTAVGIMWLDPSSAPLAATVALTSVLIPLLLQPLLTERDLRVRDHTGALTRYYLDALLGLVSVRTHGAEPALRREHESLLVEWVQASRARDRLALAIEAFQSIVGIALMGWLFFSYFSRVGEPGAALLLLYWAFSLPNHGRELALALRQLPAQRNVALRLLEPLGAIEEHDEVAPRASADDSASRAAALKLEAVTVVAGGHTILEDVDLEIAAGAHVGIVGPSGAGKSSIVGLVLGWHRAAAGSVLVDGEPLTPSKLDALRGETAWVDPAIQIWNRPMLDNLLYGAPASAERQVGAIIDQADLSRVLETLPDGLSTSLGEGGGLVSGGEGQRVRFGRAALRRDARLVIPDEPFRGLDREKRRDLLDRARLWWKDATLLCITHDVGETLGFERVIVIDGGRVAEDGAPNDLAGTPGSRYGAMLAAEAEVRTGMWASSEWRRIRLQTGLLNELDASAREASAPEAPEVAEP